MDTPKKIELLGGGRFISHHLGATCAHDSRHIIIKVPMSGGGFMELVKELQADGSFRDHLLTYCNGDQFSIIEYPRN